MKIYIVLTHTGTILSRIIRLLTKNQYTHASISLDVNMIGMYSFGRLNPCNPFIGGFVREGINIGTFKRFKNTRTEVYSLEVTKDEYTRLREIIKQISINRNIYGFNIAGLLFALFHKRLVRRNKFYCSEFVRYILEESSIRTEEISKVIKPEDFRKLKILNLEYKGLLRKYDTDSIVRIDDNIKRLELYKISEVMG